MIRVDTEQSCHTDRQVFVPQVVEGQMRGGALHPGPKHRTDPFCFEPTTGTCLRHKWHTQVDWSSGVLYIWKTGMDYDDKLGSGWVSGGGLSPSLWGTAEDVMKVHLVAETVPLGTTFCQKVPEGTKEREAQNKENWNTSSIAYSTAVQCTLLQYTELY